MYQKDEPKTIQSMFNSIAKRYDLTNSILSFSLHKYWNRTLVQHIIPYLSSQPIFLDLCSGTGDIAYQYLKKKKTSPSQVYFIDFSSEMLEYAKAKSARFNSTNTHQLFYIEADVQNIPLNPHFADCATMAYGIRNVQNPNQCIQDVFRVLKPGGCFAILELTRPKYKFLRWGHQLYLNSLMPILGKWLTDNKEAYQYLCQSIQNFISPQELESLLRKNGFAHTQTHSLGGGIATILIGHKPHDK